MLVMYWKVDAAGRLVAAWQEEWVVDERPERITALVPKPQTRPLSETPAPLARAA
jgi:hypothetical protein